MIIYLKTFISKQTTIDNAEIKQNEFKEKFNALSGYSPRNKKYIEAKNTLLDNTKNFFEVREKISEGFKKGMFLLKSDDESKIINYNELNERINKKEVDIDNEIFKNYFCLQKPSVMLKILYYLNDRKKTKTY